MSGIGIRRLAAGGSYEMHTIPSTQSISSLPVSRQPMSTGSPVAGYHKVLQPTDTRDPGSEATPGEHDYLDEPMPDCLASREDMNPVSIDYLRKMSGKIIVSEDVKNGFFSKDPREEEEEEGLGDDEGTDTWFESRQIRNTAFTKTKPRRRRRGHGMKKLKNEREQKEPKSDSLFLFDHYHPYRQNSFEQLVSGN